jgi:hypothetical protein
MKIQIQPVTYNLPDGEMIAEIADINYTDGDAATFQNLSMQLQTAEGLNINGRINISIAGEDYINWNNSDAWAIDFCLNTKNLQKK